MADPLTAHLVCPRCRGAEARPAALLLRKHSLVCRRCRARFPVVDGVPVVLRNRDWSPPPPGAGEVAMVGNYVLSHYPERCATPRQARRLGVNRRLMQWLLDALARHAPPAGAALELGCGPGAYAAIWSRFAAFTILCDIRPEFAFCASRQWGTPDSQRIGAVIADAHDPPFRGESMALVAALNLLDVTTEPWLLLAQIDALLHPGGIAVLTMPFLQNFAGPQEIISTLQGKHPELPHLSYATLASKDWLPWVIPAGDRLVHEYRVHALVARKN
ncbi:MAG: methyltransferase domain-containing protein [Bryobacterales bacterium]|nr:methyltransferase domain-containing protein [Bryobacterales bacterium]